MLNNLSDETYEWYQQALHCERQADAQTDPKVKQQFLALNRLKNEAENLFRSRGENVAAIEIVRSEKPTLRVFH
jgi:hypothetical protein